MVFSLRGRKRKRTNALFHASTGGAMSTSYKAVQEMLREIGIVISKRGETHRINFFGGLEETAYYTTSLPDALNTGVDMARVQGRSGTAVKSGATVTQRAAATALHPVLSPRQK
jgi:hypothetical protein